jgi:aspartate oxidase
MEQIKFYLDEHIHRAVAEGLRRRGVNVLTAQEAGNAGLSDRDQLLFASAEKRVMVTMDSDFLILTTQGLAHAGIAYANPRKSIGDLIGALRLLADVLDPIEMVDHVEYL